MSWRVFFTSTALLFLGFLLVNSSNGRATAANEGNTGAPGDNAPAGRTCQTCHNGTTIQVALNIEVTDLDGNAVSSYIPGNTYNVAVAVNTVAGTPSKYGFQLVSERDSDQQSINGFANPSDNAKLASITSGRQYVEHKGASSANTFSVQWTAPDAGTGTVTFYSAGNGVNGNNQSSGDGANKTSFTLQEEIGSAVFDLPAPASLLLTPNPAVGSVQVNAPQHFFGPCLVRIIDQQGRILRQQTELAIGGNQAATLHLEDLPAGTYFVQVLGAHSEMALGRLVKL